MQTSIVTLTKVVNGLNNGPVSVDGLMEMTGLSRNTVRLMVSRLRRHYGCTIKFFNGTYRAIDLSPFTSTIDYMPNGHQVEMVP